MANKIRLGFVGANVRSVWAAQSHYPALLASLSAPEPVVLGVTAVVAALGAVLAASWTLKPAGSLFFIFAVGAIGSLPGAVPVGVAVLIAASSAWWEPWAGWPWRRSCSPCPCSRGTRWCS